MSYALFQIFVIFRVCGFSEQEIQKDEIASLQAMKTRLKTRMAELEDELKKTKEDLEKQKQISKTSQPEEVCKMEAKTQNISLLYLSNFD